MFGTDHIAVLCFMLLSIMMLMVLIDSARTPTVTSNEVILYMGKAID
jgi:hypothetical protein